MKFEIKIRTASITCLFTLSFFLTIFPIVVCAAGKEPQPWLNPALPVEKRASLLLEQMTLDEKLSLVHGNGMAHESQWTMRWLRSQTVARATLKESIDSASRLWSFRMQVTEYGQATRTGGTRLLRLPISMQLRVGIRCWRNI